MQFGFMLRAGVLCVTVSGSTALKLQNDTHSGSVVPTVSLSSKKKTHLRANARREDEDKGCGLLESFPNAKPKDYRDARKSRYDQDAKKSVPNIFVAGDIIDFECNSGYTTDGAADGETEFEVECLEEGYYKPKGVCSKASKCGALPEIDSAAPTGKSDRGGVEFACIKGYSLDGEKVVAGGEGKNNHFKLKCVEFKGQYEKFSGKCQPYAFVPATETIRMYNDVFEALFRVSCKSTLKKEFGKCGDKACEPPAGLDGACAKITHGDDASDKKSECDKLVSDIKKDFEDKKKDREDFDKEEKRDGNWFKDDKDNERPHLNDEADTFCKDLWGVLKV
jgi:hypothetical protein